MFRKKNLLIILFLVVGCLYLLTLRGVAGRPEPSTLVESLGAPGQPFESSQERARYLLSESIWQKKTFKLDEIARAALPDVAFKDGHYYSVFPPGVSFIILPAYILGQLISVPVLATFVVPLFFSILTTVFVYLTARRLGLSESASFISAFVFSLASFSWNYSITLYAHIFSAFALTAGTYFALLSRNGSTLNYLAVWFLYGLAVIVDYPNALIMLPIIVLIIVESFRLTRDAASSQKIVVRWRPEAIASSVFFFLFLLLLGFYNLKTFGSWSDMAHNYRVTSLVGDSINYHFSIREVLNFKYIEKGLKVLLFSLEKGLFFYVPVFLLSFFGFKNQTKEQSRFGQLALSILILNLLVYAAFYDPWGGWSFGPRYLVPSLPFLAILLGLGYEKMKSKIAYIFSFLVLTLLSSAINLIGVLSTNLIPPSAESGKSIFAPLYILENIDKIQPSSYIFSLISNKLPFINILEFGGLIMFVIALFLIPVVLGRSALFMKNKESFGTKEETNLAAGREANVHKAI